MLFVFKDLCVCQIKVIKFGVDIKIKLNVEIEIKCKQNFVDLLKNLILILVVQLRNGLF